MRSLRCFCWYFKIQLDSTDPSSTKFDDVHVDWVQRGRPGSSTVTRIINQMGFTHSAASLYKFSEAKDDIDEKLAVEPQQNVRCKQRVGQTRSKTVNVIVKSCKINIYTEEHMLMEVLRTMEFGFPNRRQLKYFFFSYLLGVEFHCLHTWLAGDLSLGDDKRLGPGLQHFVDLPSIFRDKAALDTSLEALSLYF